VTSVSTVSPPEHAAFWVGMHEPFLERASDPELAGDDRIALAGFLTLRFADRAGDFREEEKEALAYQARATNDYLDDLEPSEEVTHLREIVRVATAVGRGKSTHLLSAPLLAFAYWLEQELRLAEALDVVETAQRIKGLTPSEVVRSSLQQARIQRLTGRLDEARRTYAAAGARAEEMGDRHSVLLSRIGDAIVSRQLGNLPASESALRDVLKRAEACGDEDAQARAHHDLGLVVLYRGRAQESVPHLHQAFEMYEQRSYKVRALSDIGEAFKRLGHYSAARDAFRLVMSAATQQMRAYTMVALLELSALSRDRVAFARWRRELEQVRQQLPPERLVDYDLQVGLGLIAFGEHRKARQYLKDAVSNAERFGIHEYGFMAERALKELDEIQAGTATTKAAAIPPEFSDEVANVAEKLCLLHTI
jgi:tetratricopeptide (TPR) repeat protein